MVQRNSIAITNCSSNSSSCSDPYTDYFTKGEYVQKSSQFLECGRTDKHNLQTKWFKGTALLFKIVLLMIVVVVTNILTILLRVNTARK